jgi:hypothetical protein
MTASGTSPFPEKFLTSPSAKQKEDALCVRLLVNLQNVFSNVNDSGA